MGLKKPEARTPGSDMIVENKKKKQKQSVVSEEDYEEELGGITGNLLRTCT